MSNQNNNPMNYIPEVVWSKNEQLTLITSFLVGPYTVILRAVSVQCSDH